MFLERSVIHPCQRLRVRALGMLRVTRSALPGQCVITTLR